MPRNALRHHRRRERGPSYRPNFELDFDAYPPSVANLPAALVANSTSVTPQLRYKSGDAAASTWPAWGYGETLTKTTGTPVLNTGSPLLGSVDDGMNCNASGHYEGSVTLGAVTTQHLCIEFLAAVSPSGTPAILGKLKPAYNGVDVYGSGGTFVLRLRGADGTATIATAVLSVNGINFIQFFVNPSVNSTSGGQAYVNGAASGSGVNCSGIGSLDATGGKWYMGNNLAGQAVWNSPLYYVAQYAQANWFAGVDDPAEWLTIHKTRFAQLTGTYPVRAAGTALPTALTRSTTGYLDKVEADGTTKLYLMGANWPRVCSRLDSAGVLRKGLLVESAGTNSALQSEVAGTTWAVNDASVAASNSAAAPNGATTADTLTASANGGYLKQAFGTITAVSRTYSHWVQRNGAGNVAGILRLVKTSDESTIASTAFTATSSWQRISVTGTCVLNDTETRLIINTSGESLYVWGGQLETGPAPSSYVPTTTAAVTRTVDVPPYYVANDGNVTAGRGSLEVGFLSPSYDQAGQPTLAHISDGDADDRIALHAASAGDDVVTLDVTAGTTQYAAVASTTDVYNGAHHKIRGTWNANDARLIVDGTSEGTPDVTVTVPTGLTRIDIGGRLGAAGTECNGLITRLAVYR